MRGWVSLVALLLLFGCEVTEGPRASSVKKFVPPEDGRITEKMTDAYIKSSKYLLEAIKGQEKTIEKIVQKHGLSPDLSELSDSLFVNKNKDVIRAWDEITKRWEEDEKNAYKKAGITEEEFNWIGGALTDSTNIDMQKKIAEALESIQTE